MCHVIFKKTNFSNRSSKDRLGISSNKHSDAKTTNPDGFLRYSRHRKTWPVKPPRKFRQYSSSLLTSTSSGFSAAKLRTYQKTENNYLPCAQFLKFISQLTKKRWRRIDRFWCLNLKNFKHLPTKIKVFIQSFAI